MLKDYSNEDVNTFFDRLDEREERDWLCMVIEKIKEKYPDADHWTMAEHNKMGEKTNIDIRIGVKDPDKKRGSPRITIFQSAQVLYCAVHKKIPYLNDKRVITTYDESPTEQSVESWLLDVDRCLSQSNLHMNGRGLSPKDYMSEADAGHGEISVDAFNQQKNVNIPLNLILYGPPGTGKTYETIHAAVQVLEPETATAYYKAIKEAASDEQRQVARKVLKDRFKLLQDEKRIRFVTFHQSFSYEDFVEGLRANTVDGTIQYDVEPGVFKLICKDAEATPETVNLDGLLDQFIEDVAMTPVTLKTPTGKEFRVSHTPGNSTLACEPLSSEIQSKLPANVGHIRSVLANKPVEKMYCASYVKGIAEYLRKKLPQSSPKAPTPPIGKPYVLIIDEINRGNVSRIFGELITLIESSKRAGASEELSVTLPYSKEVFQVPSNVYLIGTMNTADRSLSGLDIALRRRFEFREMPPQPELLDPIRVEGVDVSVGELLRVMNKRIELLLDRDHCLGHAYFMTIENGAPLEALAVVFRLKVLPLLQEYFFEDWQRIQWVLNDHRKAEVLRFVRQPKSEIKDLFGEVEGLNEQQRRWEINADAFNNPDSFNGIVSVAGSE